MPNTGTNGTNRDPRQCINDALCPILSNLCGGTPLVPCNSPQTTLYRSVISIRLVQRNSNVDTFEEMSLIQQKTWQDVTYFFLLFMT